MDEFKKQLIISLIAIIMFFVIVTSFFNFIHGCFDRPY